MTDQPDFGVNWVKGFSVRRSSVSMDTNLKFCIIQHGLHPLLRCSATLSCYAVDFVPLTL